MHSKRVFALGKYVYVLRTIITSITNVLFVKLYSLYFSPEEYGKYTLVYYGFSLVSSVVFGVINDSALRFYDEYRSSGKIKGFIGTCTRLFVGINAIFIVLLSAFIVGYYYLTKDSSTTLLLVFLAFLVIPSNLFISTTTLNRAEENFFELAIADMLFIALKLVFFIIGVEIFRFKVEAIVFSNIISNVLISIVLLKKLDCMKNINIRSFDKGLLKNIVQYGVPLMGLPIANWILSSSDRYIIGLYYTSSEVGIYSIPYIIVSNIFALLTLVITTLGYPTILKIWNLMGKKKTEELINQYLSLYIMLAIPSIFGLYMISNELVLLLSSQNYSTSRFLILCLAIGMFFAGLLQFTNKKWELNKRTDILLKISLLTGCINIGLNLAFIPMYGYVAAAVSTAIAYIISFVVSLSLYRGYLRIQVPSRYVLISLIGSLVMSIAVSIVKMLSNSYLVTTILSAFIGVIVYVSFCFSMSIHKSLFKMFR